MEGVDDFKRDGFLLVPNIISAETVALLKSRFEPLFAGEFETVGMNGFCKKIWCLLTCCVFFQFTGDIPR
jgi:hypothetical protein